MNVFGLDLSITAAGLAPDGDITETVGGQARDGDRRLITIRNRVRRWLRVREYDLAVLEGFAFGGSEVVAMAMVHGVVRPELIAADIPYTVVYPSTLKMFATGKGVASKSEMQAAAEAMAGRKFADDNRAEAWLLRRMGCAAMGDRTGLTDAQIDTIGRVKGWPLKLDPYGPDLDVGQIAQCRHKIWSLRNGEHWVHPFTLDRCDKPPK